MAVPYNLNDFLKNRDNTCTLYFVINHENPVLTLNRVYLRAKQEYINMRVIKITEDDILAMNNRNLQRERDFFVYTFFDLRNRAFGMTAYARNFGLPLIHDTLLTRNVFVNTDRPVFSVSLLGKTICVDQDLHIELKILLKDLISWMAGVGQESIEGVTHFVTDSIPCGLDWQQKKFWQFRQRPQFFHYSWVTWMFEQLKRGILNVHGVPEEHFHFQLFEGMKICGKYVRDVNRRGAMRYLVHENGGEFIEDDDNGGFDLLVASEFTFEAMQSAQRNNKLIVTTDWIETSDARDHLVPFHNYLPDNLKCMNGEDENDSSVTQGSDEDDQLEIKEELD